jgi:3',5'-cyclic AMP phosphodiesterase CpdA
MLLAQISDLHISEPGHLVCGRIDTAAYLARCIERLRSLAVLPDAVIVTGDLVDHGTVREYETLRELLAPLTMPVYLMLGNHDNRGAFREVFRSSQYAGDYVQYSFDVGALRVIALDSHDPGNPGGTLCSERRAWLERELIAAGGRQVVIALHHPPFTTGIASMDACGLDRDDTAALAAIVARYPNIERVLCGHLHRAITTRFAGTLASTAPSCAHQLALDFTPDGAAAFTFEPPAFLQHLLVDGSLVTHYTQIDAADGPYPF